VTDTLSITIDRARTHDAGGRSSRQGALGQLRRQPGTTHRSVR
jgi:hypothetical protein